MNSLQLSIDLSFEQLVAIVKQLSPHDKRKLNDVIWENEVEILRSEQNRVMRRVKNAEKHPERLIPWGEAVKRLRSKSK